MHFGAPRVSAVILFTERRVQADYHSGVARDLESERMVGMFGQKVSLAQAQGPDVELVVKGTEFYATYETPEGFPAVYDEARGLFCYARVVRGRFESTGIPVTEQPPSGVTRHATESDEVRGERIEQRTQQMERRAHPHRQKE